ncbi:hypothetical protein Tco_0247934 [Tanacetum coccineum]
MNVKLALLEAIPSTSQTTKNFQPKNKGLVAKTFNWGKKEVFDDEVTHVKVLMALADELIVGKNHAQNGKWINITIRKVKRLNPNSYLLNFNTRRILVLESQSVNKSLKLTEGSYDPESVKDSEKESITPLPPLKILQGASPSTKESPSKSVSGTVIENETEPVTPSVPT